MVDGCKMYRRVQDLGQKSRVLGFCGSVLSKIYAYIDAASRAEFAHGPVINALHELRVGLSAEFQNISCRTSRLDFVHSCHIASNA